MCPEGIFGWSLLFDHSMPLMARAAVLLFSIASLAPRASAVIVDRIAAVVESQIITLSEVDQMVNLRVILRESDESDQSYRRRILDDLVAQSLRLSDAERFGATDVSKDSIEARLVEIIGRFPSQTEFDQALQRSEMTLDELRVVLKRQLQVDKYIEERFSPQIFVSIEEIDAFFRGPWSEQREARGLTLPPLASVTEEIRSLLKAERLRDEVSKWTSQLRARANVDIYAFR